jgi:hypothetical protein
LLRWHKEHFVIYSFILKAIIIDTDEQPNGRDAWVRYGKKHTLPCPL